MRWRWKISRHDVPPRSVSCRLSAVQFQACSASIDFLRQLPVGGGTGQAWIMLENGFAVAGCLLKADALASPILFRGWGYLTLCVQPMDPFSCIIVAGGRASCASCVWCLARRARGHWRHLGKSPDAGSSGSSEAAEPGAVGAVHYFQQIGILALCLDPKHRRTIVAKLSTPTDLMDTGAGTT